MDTEVKEKKQIERIDTACLRYKEVNKSNHIKFNKLGDWLDKESMIFKKETIINNKTFKKLHRGQVIKVDFGINIGSELCYIHFAIVLNDNDTIYNDNVTIVPITSKKGESRINVGKLLHNIYPNSTKYNLISYVNILQIRTISKSRILQNNKNYICSDEIMDKIDKEIILQFTKKDTTK